MYLDILVFFGAGVALGVLAGMVPGLHPNTVFVMLASSLVAMKGEATIPTLAFVVSLSVTNTIVNFIPSIFLGAPEPDNCLSVLPGHRLLLKGSGYEALYLTVLGGMAVMLLTVIAFPFTLWLIPFIYAGMHGYMHWLLMAVLALLLFQERGWKMAKSAAFFLISGAAGLFLLSSFQTEQVLFPALTGLFGLSVISMSIGKRTVLPEQAVSGKPEWKWVKGGVAGWLAGLFVGILPGIGSAQAGVLASRALRGEERDFLVALGGINTANIMFTFMAMYTVRRIRSGAAWFLSEVVGGITLGEMCFILFTGVLSCFIAGMITIRLGKSSLSALQRLDYRKVNVLILLVMLVLLVLLGGIPGLLIAALSLSIGIACTRLGVKRMYLMGFLMLPTIMHYSGMPVY